MLKVTALDEKRTMTGSKQKTHVQRSDSIRCISESAILVALAKVELEIEVEVEAESQVPSGVGHSIATSRSSSALTVTLKQVNRTSRSVST